MASTQFEKLTERAPTFAELAKEIHGGNDRFFFRRMARDMREWSGGLPHDARILGIDDRSQLLTLAEAEEKHYGGIGDPENRNAAAQAREKARQLIAEAEERERKQAAAELDYGALSKRRAQLTAALTTLLPRRKARLEDRRKRFAEEVDWAMRLPGRWLWLVECSTKLATVDAALSRVPIVEKSLKEELADVENRMRLMEAGAPRRK